MATIDVRTAIHGVGGGTFTVEVLLRDAATGGVVDTAVSDPVVVPATEVMSPDVQIPEVRVYAKGRKR